MGYRFVGWELGWSVKLEMDILNFVFCNKRPVLIVCDS
jgi:hypothetical protein